MVSRGTRIYLRTDWWLKSTSLVDAAGEIVASEAFVPRDWYPTIVPTTVLSALVRNGVYPDPRVGLNNFLIPDAADEFNARHNLGKYSYLPDGRNPWRDPYWFRTEFRLPTGEPATQRRWWLTFEAINYRAEVWLNGHLVIDRQQMVGAFQRFRFDITEQARPGEANYLAVKVFGVDHPGVPGEQFEPFCRPRTHQPGLENEIFKDVTINLSAVGYDCAPEVRDRLMGLWQAVYVEASGPVVVRDPFVQTTLPLPETSPARLTVSTDLLNATSVPQQGVLRAEIAGVGTVEAAVALAPGEVKTVVFAPEDNPQLVVAEPRLWWPIGYGEQPLYKLVVTFEQAGQISDQAEATFGIRQVSQKLHWVQGEPGLWLHVNGQRIFGRGGYLQYDTLLDADWFGEERLLAELRYLAHANLNLLAVEDAPNLPDLFLDLCDRLGLMFWNDFYQCHWVGKDDFPQDHDLLERCTIDVVKRYRNHPSLVMYMCANEGTIARDQYIRWRRAITELDGTRPFIPSGYPDAVNRHNWPEWIKPDTPTGANDSLPKSYTWKPHSWFYSMVRDDRSWMFKIESGSASLPPVRRLQRIVPDIREPSEVRPFPLNRTFVYHGANRYYQDYDQAIRRRFGEPESLEDYCWKGHLVTFDQHRAMFEAVNSLRWDVTSGFMQWKLNSCWPDVQWQLYDYYLGPAVALYAIRKACESLHAQLNPVSQTVTVINTQLAPVDDLTVRARVFDLEMRPVWEHEQTLRVGADCFSDVFRLPLLKPLTQVYFVRLDLLDAGGAPVSDNFYWLSSRPGVDDAGCFLDLKLLPRVHLSASHAIEDRGDEAAVSVRLTNPTTALAFFTEVVLTREPDGEDVVPIYWNDNYVSLLPGESRVLHAVFPTKALGGGQPRVGIEGWNVPALKSLER